MKLDYIGRSKITPRSNIRGSVASEGAMNNLDETELNQFVSRDTEEEGSSGSSCRRDEHFAEKMNNHDFIANSGSNNMKISIQLGLSEGLYNSSTKSVSTVFLKSGMEYWNGAGAAQTVGKESSRVVCLPGSLAPNINHHARSTGRSADYWIQDEKELKRQKRKEANRESARRSRMRKQAECDELSEKVQNLTAENETLRTEVSRLNDLCQKLSADNAVLLERLGK